MVRKETPQQREYYKPFRCAAGYVLALSVVMNALTAASSGISLAGAFVFKNEFLQTLFTSGVLYGCIILAYYLCYMIFFRKYIDRLFTLEPLRHRDIPGCLLVCLGTFFYVLACWDIWWLIGGFSTEEAASLSLIDILYACLAAPIMEEIVFRYWLRKVMKPYGRWCYVLISALFFGLFHGTFSQSVPAIFIGLAFGLIAWHYDSIIPTVILHIANNSLSTLSNYYPVEISDYVVYGLTGAFLLIMLALSVRKLKWKEFPKPFKLMPHSISCMFFIILYVALIIIGRLFAF